LIALAAHNGQLGAVAVRLESMLRTPGRISLDWRAR